jgi:hypothetical protein
MNDLEMKKRVLPNCAEKCFGFGKTATSVMSLFCGYRMLSAGLMIMKKK